MCFRLYYDFNLFKKKQTLLGTTRKGEGDRGINDRDWYRDLWKKKRANEDDKHPLLLDEGVLPAVQRS